MTCDTEGKYGRISKRFLKKVRSEGAGCIDAWQGTVNGALQATAMNLQSPQEEGFFFTV